MKKIFVLFLLSSAMTALSQTPVWPPAGGGGGGGSVTSVGATGTALVNATVTNPTTTPTVVLTLPNQPANSVVGNFTGSAAAPVASTTPAFSAVNLNSFPTGQFATSVLVSPVTSGLIGEFHFQDATNATVSPNFVSGGTSGTYFGTPTLTGTTKGGMISAGAGGMDLPVAFNTTALTLATYTCTDSITSIANLYDILIGGLISATTPSGGNTQVYGLMLQGTQGTALGQSIGKYGLSPTVFNNITVSTQSVESVNNCHLITLIRGTTHDQLFVDDHEVKAYQYQNAGTSTTVPSSGSLGVGMAHYGTLPQANYSHPYPIYYHFDFNRALTLDEIKSLSGATAAAAVFRGITPAVQPYSDAGNQLIAVGDSITYGLNSGTNGWPALLTGLTNNVYSITNISTPGWQVENVITECQTRGQGAINPNMNNTFTIFAGTNDLAQVGGALGTVTPAVAYQRLKRAVQCYKGLTPMPRVIVFSMLSRGVAGGGSSAANDALKNQYNDLIRKDYAGADLFFDDASFPGMGADGVAVTGQSATACLSNPCYGGDFVHPTAQGQQVEANYFASFINWADSLKNGTNPVLKTVNYTETSADVAVNANPSGGAITITLPDAIGLVGTDRYVSNVQASGANTVTLTAISGQNIDGSSTLICPNATKCAVRAVLGASAGTATADTGSGAHWEQFGFSGGGGGGSGNATSIQGVAVSATAPTVTNNVLIYNGSSYAPGVVSGTTVPQASSTVQGISNCDGTTITCVGGVLSAAGGGAVSSVFTRTGAVVATTGDYTVAQVTGAAPLASPTFTGTTVISGTALNITAGAIQKGGTGAHLTNGCTVTMAAAATQACSVAISGGSSGSVCGFMATNAAAALVLSGVNPTANGNVPFITWSGAIPSLTFSTAIGQQVATGTSATFQILCDI